MCRPPPHEQALGEEFAGYLQHVVPLAIESMEQDDGMEELDDEAAPGANSAGAVGMGDRGTAHPPT